MQIINKTDYNRLFKIIVDYYLEIKKEIIKSDLVDQLSNSDDDPLSVNDRHA